MIKTIYFCLGSYKDSYNCRGEKCKRKAQIMHDSSGQASVYFNNVEHNHTTIGKKTFGLNETTKKQIALVYDELKTAKKIVNHLRKIESPFL